ncbi:MAG: hypothetical protein ABSG56_08105 [Bryobacteraceae bacterium]|jgi:hypothetical protein
MRKLILTTLFGIALGIGSAHAEDVVIRTAPPRPIVEHRGVAPSANHVWIGGYHRWDGNAYVWTPGRWDLPPRPHAVWVAPRYVHRNGGYMFVEGRWK